MNEVDLLNKIKENQCYLIGQIPLNDDEIASIMEYAKNIVNLDEKYIGTMADLLLSTAMVQVAINDYQDGKYWEFLRCKLNVNNISSKKQSLLGKIFIETIRKYKLFELKLNSSGIMQYVENIKAHAFVTNNYMEGYYDFLNDYYNNNLLRDITQEGVEGTLEDLSDYIKETVNQNTDTIYSSDDFQTKKSYKLLKSTRQVIAQCSGDILYKLFYPSLKIIDDNFYDGILPKNSNDRFSKIFIDWYNKKGNNDINRNIGERKNYNHNPYLRFKNNCFEVVIPKRRYRLTEYDGKAFVTITFNGVKPPKKDLEISKNMGTYISEECIFSIPYPFDEIKIEIVTKENIETIIPKCEYIIFNKNNIKVNRFEKGMNYLLVKPEIDVKFSNKSDILIGKEEKQEWVQYMLNIDENSVCYIDNKPLTMIGEFSTEPVYEYEIDFFKVYDENKNIIKATRRHPLITFLLDKNKIDGTTITINNKNYSIQNDNRFLINESSINDNEIIVSIDLNNIIDIVSGYYKVELNIIGEINKKIAEYLILRYFYFFFDKPVYIDEELANLNIKTEGLNISILDNECKLTYGSKHMKNYYYNIKLRSNYRNVNLKLELDENVFYIKIPINMMLYGFNENSLHYGNFDEIWYSKLSPIMYVKFLGIKDLGIYSSLDYDKVIWGEEIKEKLFRINITSILEDIQNSDEKWCDLYIKYVVNKEKWIKIFKVNKSIKIEPYFRFEYCNDIPCFNVKYNEVENVKIFYSIKENYFENSIVTNKELKPGINYLPELKENTYYDIIPFIEESDEFGLNINRITLPLRKHIFILNYDKVPEDKFNLLGSNILIDKIEFKGNYLNLDENYEYKIIAKYIDYDGNFIAELFEYNVNENRYIGKIKFKDINKLEDDKISFYIENYSKKDNEWYELYYDKFSKRIIENDNDALEFIKSNEVITLYEGDSKYIGKIRYRRRDENDF